MHTTSSLRSRHHQGAALLAVLWVIALLIGLVAGASLLLQPSLDAAIARRQAFRARMLAEGALAIAMSPNIQGDDPLLRRQINEDEEYIVEKLGEDGRLNPNQLLGATAGIPPQNNPPVGEPTQPVPPTGQQISSNPSQGRAVLETLFKSWGLQFVEAQRVVNALQDWVDADTYASNPSIKTEKGGYPNANMPFNAPFRTVEEMAMVKGMDLVERANPNWRDYFSVYAAASFDLKAATPEMLAFYFGIDPSRMAEVQRRWQEIRGPDGIPNTQDDQSFDVNYILTRFGVTNPASLPYPPSVQSSINRYVVKVRVGNLRREVSAVVQGGGVGAAPSALVHLSETTVTENTGTQQPDNQR